MAQIAALVAEYTVGGAIAAYDEPGRVLYCSTPSRPLYYDSNSPPWLALPVKEHGATWQCGDLIYIPGVGMFRALDAGPFGDHCIITGGQCLAIVADVPVIFAQWELSTAGEIINLSAVARACRARGWCDG